MDIAFVLNEKFVMPCGVLILSILKLHNEINIHFHLITEYISENNKLLLNNTVQNKNCELHYYEIKNDENLKKLPVKRHTGLATYYKWWIPSLLPESISKVLYLDSDMLCVDSILDLWNTDITNYAAAVSINQNSDNASYMDRLGYDKNDGHLYFNAGMILINMDYWRKNDISGKCIMFVEQYPERNYFSDQDAVNYATLGCRKTVSYRYNCGILVEDVKSMKVRPEYHSDIEEGQKNPAIIHFLGICKPWHKESLHPYTKLWLFVKNQTPWKNEKPKSIFKGYNKFKWIVTKIFGRKIFENLGLAKKKIRNNINFTPKINSMYDRFK